MGRIEIAGQPPTPSSWKKILPGLLISLLSLVIIFTLVDLDQLWQALQLANYWLVGVFLGLTFLWLVVRSVVWYSLLEQNYPLGNVFLAINQGYLLNNLLPFRLGEIGRAILLKSKTNISSESANPGGTGFFYIISTILIERALDLAMATGLLLITLPFVIGANWALQAAMSATGLVLVGLGGLFILARNRTWAQMKVVQISARIPLLQKVGNKQINTFLNGLTTLTDSRRFLKVTGLMILNWTIAVLQYFTLMLAFFPQAKLLFAAFSLGVVALGIAVPSSPGAIGIMELSLVGALSVFKLDPSVAFALALTAHLTNYLLTGIIGAYAFAKDGQKITDLYQRARRLSQENTN